MRWTERWREFRSSFGPLSNSSAASTPSAEATEAEAWSEKVASQFSDVSEYWNSVYSSRTVRAQVYRTRMDVATRWAAMVAGPGAAAADVGTGAGHVAVFLAERGVRVTAIDMSETMLDQVSENASRAGVAELVDLMTSDAESLELPSGSCDLVMALGLLPWVDHPELAMQEMARITKPGGHVIVTTDNALSLTRGLDPIWHPSTRRLLRAARRRALRLPASPPPAYPAATTRSRLDRLLRTAGLSPLEFSGVGFGPLTFLGRNVLPTGVGLAVDRSLQRLADKNVPIVEHAATFQVALARKPGQEEAPAARLRRM